MPRKRRSWALAEVQVVSRSLCRLVGILVPSASHCHWFQYVDTPNGAECSHSATCVWYRLSSKKAGGRGNILGWQSPVSNLNRSARPRSRLEAQIGTRVGVGLESTALSGFDGPESESCGILVPGGAVAVTVMCSLVKCRMGPVRQSSWAVELGSLVSRGCRWGGSGKGHSMVPSRRRRNIAQPNLAQKGAPAGRARAAEVQH